LLFIKKIESKSSFLKKRSKKLLFLILVPAAVGGQAHQRTIS